MNLAKRKKANDIHILSCVTYQHYQKTTNMNESKVNIQYLINDIINSANWATQLPEFISPLFQRLGGNSINILGIKLGTKLSTILKHTPLYPAQFGAPFGAPNVN